MDSSLWPQRTVPKLPSGTNGCQTLKTGTLNTIYFCQKRPLCQPPPSPTPPPYSHFVRKVKLRLAYRLAFVIDTVVDTVCWVQLHLDCIKMIQTSFASKFLVSAECHDLLPTLHRHPAPHWPFGHPKEGIGYPPCFPSSISFNSLSPRCEKVQWLRFMAWNQQTCHNVCVRVSHSKLTSDCHVTWRDFFD